MPQINVAPRAQKNLKLSIGADTYEKHVSNVQWTPTSSTAEWRGGTPDAVFTDTTSPTWTANITLVQDFETEDSLANFLLDHAGEQVEMKYKPDADGTFEISATVTLAPPAIGGAVNAFNESTVAMGSTKPVRTPVGP
ncbi:hypothetical protein EV379_0909 [Microterricola gilva]|uniref:Phage tail tube protein n=1 Tax=Microterricola gilva TaxID=393267 RepID=A0A4V2GAK7_9MICO|nr:hypothetical protein [Microterricola gilva]RZU64606.1 hypothetical protein EV379_0909 [Microterricola gilva]